MCFIALILDKIYLIDMMDLVVVMLQYLNLVNSEKFERRKGIF